MTVKVGDKVCYSSWLLNDVWGRVIEVRENAFIKSWGSVTKVLVERKWMGLIPIRSWIEESGIIARKYRIEEQVKLIDQEINKYK